VSNPTVREIVRDWLVEHGYDGLYDSECGCGVCDLMPCDGPWSMTCRAGYAGPCDEPEFEGYECIGPQKRGAAGDGD